MLKLLFGKFKKNFENQYDIVFEYYQRKYFILNAFQDIFYIFNFISIFVFTLFFSMSFEKLPCLEFIFKDKILNVFVTYRIVLFRIFVILIVLLITFINFNEYKLIQINGSVFSAIIGFIVPVNLIR